jgi:hypothetical protein
MKKTKKPLVLICALFALFFALPSGVLGEEPEAFFALPSQIELAPSSEATVSLIVIGSSQEGRKVKLSAGQLPANLELSFQPEEVSAPGISHLKLKTTASYVPGNYLLEISADFGDQIKFAALSLKTRKALEVKLVSPFASTWPESPANIALFIYHSSWQFQLNYKLENMPQNMSSSLSQPVDIDNFTSTCTLTITSTPDVKPGAYRLTLSVTDGASSDSVSLLITVPFPDIKGHWAQNEISRLVSVGALSGYPDGNFLPDATITRAELAKVLSISFDLKMERQENSNFRDLEPNFWATPYIERLWKAKVIDGYPDGTFRPQQPVKRSEVATMIARILSWPLIPQNFPPTFLDLFQNHWAFRYIETGAWQGAWDGYPDGTFQPEKEATRAEIAVLISRLLVEP